MKDVISNTLAAVQANNKPNTDGYVTNAMLVDVAHQVGIVISKKATRTALVTALEKWMQTAGSEEPHSEAPSIKVIARQLASLINRRKEKLEEDAIDAVQKECEQKHTSSGEKDNKPVSTQEKAPEKKSSKNTLAPVLVPAPEKKTKADVIIEIVSRWGDYLAHNPNRINRAMVKSAPLKKVIAMVICGNDCKQNGKFTLTDKQQQLCKKYYDLFLRNYVVEIGDMLVIQKNLENQLVKMGFWAK